LEADHAGFAWNAIELALQNLKAKHNLWGVDVTRVFALGALEEGISNFFEMANRTLLFTPKLGPYGDWPPDGH
jgi:hypothetical protein